MKKIILKTGIVVLFAFLIQACEQRIELDAGQWETAADITSGAFMFVWDIEEGVEIPEPTGGSLDRTKTTIVSSSNVDAENAIVYVTLDDGVDPSALGCFIYFNGEKIEPIDNAPELGVITSWSIGTEYQYRIYSADGQYKDWTLIIES